MLIHIITIFPDYYRTPLEYGLLRIVQEKKIAVIHTIDLRLFAENSHRTVDDYPFGGGSGMIMKPEPLFRAVESVRGKNSTVIVLSPQGRKFNQNLADELANREHLIFICGRYKGIDERVFLYLADDEISIGDYVISGGEAAALVILEAVLRLKEGVVSDSESVRTDSFEKGLLDAPYYTRPEEFRTHRVPEILLSGNHEKIRQWKKYEMIRRTHLKRPDLIDENLLSQDEKKILEEVKNGSRDQH